MKTIVESNLESWAGLDDSESTSMKSQGQSPWGEGDNPPGVWCWSENDNQVLVGSCPGDAEIVTYDRAREIFNRDADDLETVINTQEMRLKQNW